MCISFIIVDHEVMSRLCWRGSSDLHEALWVFIWWIEDLVIVTMEIVTMRPLWSVAETQRAGKTYFGQMMAEEQWSVDSWMWKPTWIHILPVDYGFLFLPRLHKQMFFIWNDKYLSLILLTEWGWDAYVIVITVMFLTTNTHDPRCRKWSCWLKKGTVIAFTLFKE